jgi:hypothetical protein
MTTLPQFQVTEFWHLEVIKVRGNKHTCLLNFLLLWSRATAPLRLKLAPSPDVQSSTNRTSYICVMNFYKFQLQILIKKGAVQYKPILSASLCIHTGIKAKRPVLVHLGHPVRN